MIVGPRIWAGPFIETVRGVGYRFREPRLVES